MNQDKDSSKKSEEVSLRLSQIDISTEAANSAIQSAINSVDSLVLKEKLSFLLKEGTSNQKLDFLLSQRYIFPKDLEIIAAKECENIVCEVYPCGEYGNCHVCYCADANEFSLLSRQVEGYYISRMYLDIKHNLFTTDVKSEKITAYIKKHRPNWDQPFSVEALAARILEVANILLIDPRIFTALIRKESAFNMNAVSPTGAVGSTQITTIAVKEFMDQVGMTIQSRIDADKTAVAFFRDAIKKLIPNLDPGVYNFQTQAQENQWAAMFKDWIKSSSSVQTAVGGLILKVYLGYQSKQIGLDTAKNIFTATDASSLSARKDIYDKSLQMYNGEPGDAKVKYASSILKFSEEIG